jgi:hypothetical protein
MLVEGLKTVPVGDPVPPPEAAGIATLKGMDPVALAT